MSRKERLRIVVIGGGAAGFFGAITCAETFPDCKVTLLEKSNKLLAKVKISGGGRRNVTHACFERSRLVRYYPRGEKPLLHPFVQFDAGDTVKWFEQRGVPVKTETDGRMFPATNDSQTIVDCLLAQARKTGVEVQTSVGVSRIESRENRFLLTLLTGDTITADRVLVATGGNPQANAYQWLATLGHRIEPPVPSLFTFNVPDSPLLDLAGIAVPEAAVKIVGTKLQQTGPVLVTHWGFSGPAILRLSAWGARELAEKQYQFQVIINWLPQCNEESLRTELVAFRDHSPRKLIAANALYTLPGRFWKRFTELAEISETTRWADLPKKNLNKLVELLTRSTFPVRGKSTFKDEFVTCGGISGQDIHWQTMESKACPGLYFAGEVLDVDGITGGFNFQAAWTTGYIAGKNMGK